MTHADTFDPMRDVEDFHRKFGLEYVGRPRALQGELARFRADFMDEELTEYRDEQRLLVDAIEGDDAAGVSVHLANQLDALVDLVYVALGTAHMHGFDFRAAWRRVQAANMAKVRVERVEDSKRGSTFDVVKPPGWTAPDHLDLVEDHAHR